MAIGSKLWDILHAFQKYVNDNNDTQGQAAYSLVEQSIEGSDALQAQLNALADTNKLTAINWTNSDVAENGTNTIEIGSQYFASISNTDQVAELLGHEGYHLENATHIASENDAWNTSLTNWSQGTSTADSYVQSYQQFNNENEAGASITGINQSIHSYMAEHQLTTMSQQAIQQLEQLDPSIGFAFDGDGNLKSGFVGHKDAGGQWDGTLDFDASLSAAATASGARLSSGGVSDVNDNNQYYGAYAVSRLLATNTSGQPVSIDFAADGLLFNKAAPGTPLTDAEAINLLMKAYANNGNTAPHPFGQLNTNATAQLRDVATGALITITNTGTQAAATYLVDMTVPAADPTQSSVHTQGNLGTQGDVVNSFTVTTAPDGSESATISGSGASLEISNSKISLDAGTKAKVIGNNDVITLQNSSQSELTVNGQSNEVDSAGNTIHIQGEGSSVTLGGYGSKNTITMDGNDQSLSAAAAWSTTVAIGSNATGEIINAPGIAANVGDNSSVTLTGYFFTYTGGKSNQLTINGGINTITVGDGSNVQINSNPANSQYNGSNTITMSHGTLSINFDDSNAGGDTLLGSNNTITSMGGSFSLNGDSNTYTSKAPTHFFSLSGNGNTITAGDGGYFTVSGGTGNAVNISGATVYAEDDAELTVNGSGNTIDVSTSGTNLALSGSDNTINATDGGNIQLLSGNNYDIYLDGGSLIVGNDITAKIELENSNIAAGNNDTFTLENGNNAFIAEDGSTLTFAEANGGNSDGTTLAMNQGTIHLSDSMSLAIAGNDNTVIGGSATTLSFKGTGEKVVATNSTIAYDGSGAASGNASISITGNGNLLTASHAAIAFGGGNAGDSLIVHGTDNAIAATKQQLDLRDEGVNNVNGDGNTITDTYGATLNLSGTTLNQITTLKGGAYTINATTSGNTLIAGNNLTFNGASGSSIAVTGAYNVLNISNAQITISSTVSVTIVGSNNTIVADPNVQANLTITGTNDKVTASNSSIVFVGDNTGDTVTGPGDTGSNWSAPDPDLPPGNSGGYHPPSTGANTMMASRQAYLSTTAFATERHGDPRLQGLLHALAAFGAQDGAALDMAPTTPHATEHLHLSAAA